MQKLMTREIERATPELYGTDGQGREAVATAHFFSPIDGWQWYLTEYDPETGEAFGLVKGFADELGYFSIRELERMNELFGAGTVELDAGFEPCKLSEVM